MKKIQYFALALMTLCAPEAAAQQTWSLKQCINYATEHNISIKQRAQTVESQKVQLNTAKNSRLPNVSGQAGQSFNFGRGLTIDNTYANRNTMSTSLGVNTSVPLFTGGQITAQIEQTQLDLQAALADLSRARESIGIQVTSAYLDALYQRELWQVAQDQVALSRVQQERIQALYNNGKSAESELAEAKAAVAGDELAATQSQNNYQLALLDLSQLLELSTPEGFDIEAPHEAEAADLLPVIPDEIFATAVSSKPEILAEQLRLKSAEKGIDLARSALYPQLSLGGSLSTNYYKTSGSDANSFSRQLKDNLTKYVGFTLSVPIFNRYATRNQIKAAQIQRVNQELTLENTKKSLYKEIQQAYYNAVAAQKQCASSEVAEAASQSAFELMTRKYDNGKATATEFQQTKTKLMKATADRIQAKYTLLFRTKILDFYRGVPLQ